MAPKPDHPGKSGQAPGHNKGHGGPVGDEWGPGDQHHREGPTYPRRGRPQPGPGPGAPQQSKGCLWELLDIPRRLFRAIFKR